jgi:hypothetical protein
MLKRVHYCEMHFRLRLWDGRVTRRLPGGKARLPARCEMHN